MAEFLEEMPLRVRIHNHEGLDQHYDSRDSIKTMYTNKEFLVKQQEQYLNMLSITVNLGTIRKSTTHHPSSRPTVTLYAKNRVNIATLSQNVDTTVNGKFFLCRCITPPDLTQSIMMVVDDPEGEQAVRLSLYNYSNSKSDVERIFPVGQILAIINPWFKSTLDGGLMVRCDSPGEVVVISSDTFQNDFPGLSWKGEIPPKYNNQAILPGHSSRVRYRPIITTRPFFQAILPKTTTHSQVKPGHAAAIELKNMGNKAFAKKEFADAIRFYSQSLELLPNNVDSLANRSAAFNNLGCYNKGLQDATAVVTIEPEHVEGIYRSVKSLWGLNRYKEAVDFLNTKFSRNRDLKNDTNLKHFLKQAISFFRQNQTGQYDIVEILKGNGKCMEVAEFTGSVEIKEIPGKGRGLVATKTVKAGQLLICSKAFAFYQPQPQQTDEPESVIRNYDPVKSQHHDEIVGIVAQKLSLDPTLGSGVYNLFAGPELGFITGGTNVGVDMKRIDKIIKFNVFSVVEVGVDTKKNEIMGLWILPSYINHSCIDANSYYAIYNDIMLIRAVKPIKEGEEILFPYISPASPFENRQAVFDSHVFECCCLLCTTQIGESEDNRATRRDILQSLQSIGPQIANRSQLHQVLQNIQKLYSTLNPNYPVLSWCLSSVTMIRIAEHLFHAEIFNDCIELLEKIYIVTKDTANAKEAALVSVMILGSYSMLIFLGQQKNSGLIDTWIANVKHDLIVAYGTLGVMNVIGEPTLAILRERGINFF